MNGIKVLSLFDGLGCGHIAFDGLGIPIDRYVAYEIDKYAIKTATHNFPDIEECGDVFQGDFTQYQGFDWLVGGSPCTHWSIAQTKHRETTASGIGWELFSQYVRALHEAQPKFFLYENNKSMSNAIRESISETFGFEPVCINSALVSAQNRQRLYWVGRRNADGTYNKVPIEQPEDRGILLRDILEITTGEKAYALQAPANMKSLTEKEMDYMVRETKDGRNHFDFDYFHDATRDKSACVTANTHKGVPYNVLAEPVRIGTIENDAKNPDHDSQQYRVYSPDGKSVTLCGNGGGVGAKTGLYAAPVRVGDMPNAEGVIRGGQAHRIYDSDGKAVTLTARPNGGGVDGPLYAIPQPAAMRQVGRRINAEGHRDDYNEGLEHIQRFEVNEDPQKTNCLTTVQKDNMVAVPIAPPMRVREATKQGYVDIQPGECVDLSMPNSKTRRGRAMKDKSNCLTTSCDFYEYCGTLDAPVYQVKDGKITVKGREYPIKLRDGCYIIRKLTVTECKRLQQVPDSYEFPVSDSQSYKLLGNGWSCEVIKHLIRSTYEFDKKEEAI